MNSGFIVKASALPLYTVRVALRNWNGFTPAARAASGLTPGKRLFLGGVVVIMASLALVAASALASVRLITATQSVAFYENWLGRNLEGLSQAVELSCPALVELPSAYSCFFSPADGPIAQVVVRVSRGAVEQVQLAPHGDALLLGDLIAQWGKPEIEVYSRRTRLRWPSVRLEANTEDTSLPISYQAVVRRVTISAVQQKAGGRLSPQIAE
jgi:hypothetical protein